MTNRHDSGSATPDATKRYASDLHDREFALIATHVAQKSRSGKKRTVDIREVLMQNWQITGGSGAAIFAIDASTGQMTIANPSLLDFANTASYTLTVTMRGGTTTSQGPRLS